MVKKHLGHRQIQIAMKSRPKLATDQLRSGISFAHKEQGTEVLSDAEKEEISINPSNGL